MENPLEELSIGKLLNKLGTASPEKLAKLEAMAIRRKELHIEQLATINKLRLAAIRSYEPYIKLNRVIKMLKNKLEKENGKPGNYHTD